MNKLGIGNLMKQHNAGDPPYDWSNSYAVTDPHTKYTAIRTKLNDVQPTPTGPYNTQYADDGYAACLSAGKGVSFFLAGGVETPEHYFSEPNPCYKFQVTEQSGATAYMPLPFDPNWQRKIKPVIQMIGQHYPNLSYVECNVFSRREEFYFCDTDSDQAALESVAKSYGYPDALTALRKGARWCIKQFCKNFQCPVILVMGNPVPASMKDQGEAMIADLAARGTSHFGFHFGVSSHGLDNNSPPPNSNGVILIQKYSGQGYFCTYQLAKGQKDPTALLDCFTRGDGYGASAIESYQGDNEAYPDVVDQGNAIMGL